MTLQQWLGTLSAITTTGGTLPLRYSFVQDQYLHADGVDQEPPANAPYVSVRYGLARPVFRSHKGDVISDRRINMVIHQFPDPSTGKAPDIGAAIALFRELLKTDGSVTKGTNQAAQVGRLTLDGWLEPQENTDSRKLLGQITWVQKIQFFGL